MNKEERAREVTRAIVEEPRLRFVGPGWAKLILPLIEKADEEGANILQIKEKFGGLRFYATNASAELRDMIAAAEVESFKTCEKCGEPGTPCGPGYVKTLCEHHRKLAGKVSGEHSTSP